MVVLPPLDLSALKSPRKRVRSNRRNFRTSARVGLGAIATKPRGYPPAPPNKKSKHVRLQLSSAQGRITRSVFFIPVSTPMLGTWSDTVTWSAWSIILSTYSMFSITVHLSHHSSWTSKQFAKLMLSLITTARNNGIICSQSHPCCTWVFVWLNVVKQSLY